MSNTTIEFNSKKPDRTTGILLLIFTVAFLFAGGSLLYSNNKAVIYGEKTVGLIVDYESSNCSKSLCYAKVVSFRDKSGEEIIFTENSYSESFPSVGNEVTIYYLENEPTEAIVYSFFDVYLFPSIFILAGLFIPYALYRGTK